MRENFGRGWASRGPRRMTDYDDLPNKVGSHWDYYEDGDPLEHRLEANT